MNCTKINVVILKWKDFDFLYKLMVPFVRSSKLRMSFPCSTIIQIMGLKIFLQKVIKKIYKRLKPMRFYNKNKISKIEFLN